MVPSLSSLAALVLRGLVMVTARADQLEACAVAIVRGRGDFRLRVSAHTRRDRQEESEASAEGGKWSRGMTMRIQSSEEVRIVS